MAAMLQPPIERLGSSAGTLLADARSDGATRLKLALWVGVGAVGVAVGLLALSAADPNAQPFWTYQPDSDEVSEWRKDGITALVATVCPLPLACPQWCGNETYKCNCSPGAWPIEWEFLEVDGKRFNCSFVDKDKSTPFEDSDVHMPDKVPVTLHDGIEINQTGCLQLNWPESFKEKDWESYVQCRLHTTIAIAQKSGGAEPGTFSPYPDASFDALVAVQLHTNPNHQSPFDPKKHSDRSRYTHNKTGVSTSPTAWMYFNAFSYRDLEVQPQIFRRASDSRIFGEVGNVRVKNTLRLPVSSRVGSRANSEEPIVAFSWFYYRGEYGVDWFTELTQGGKDTRTAWGVAGGIAFLLTLLNLSLFCCLSTALGLDTDRVRDRMLSVGGADKGDGTAFGGTGGYSAPSYLPVDVQTQQPRRSASGGVLDLGNDGSLPGDARPSQPPPRPSSGLSGGNPSIVAPSYGSTG